MASKPFPPKGKGKAKGKKPGQFDLPKSGKRKPPKMPPQGSIDGSNAALDKAEGLV